eukprot:m.233547 g.233547  ORF g.233547 m.233547 type:complete len:192 (+) comp19295_c0_seq14:512-1087(+)
MVEEHPLGYDNGQSGHLIGVDDTAQPLGIAIRPEDREFIHVSELFAASWPSAAWPHDGKGPPPKVIQVLRLRCKPEVVTKYVRKREDVGLRLSAEDLKQCMKLPPPGFDVYGGQPASEQQACVRANVRQLWHGVSFTCAIGEAQQDGSVVVQPCHDMYCFGCTVTLLCCVCLAKWARDFAKRHPGYLFLIE